MYPQPPAPNRVEKPVAHPRAVLLRKRYTSLGGQVLTVCGKSEDPFHLCALMAKCPMINSHQLFPMEGVYIHVKSFPLPTPTQSPNMCSHGSVPGINPEN